MVALAYALTGRAAVAEELAQDAFLVAHRNWARVSAYDVPGAFVRRVVSNMAVSFTRRLAAEARALARLAARSPKWSTPLEPTDADFWRSVRSLPRRQAQVLALRYLEDLPDDEIARILGCSRRQSASTCTTVGSLLPVDWVLKRTGGRQHDRREPAVSPPPG